MGSGNGGKRLYPLRKLSNARDPANERGGPCVTESRIGDRPGSSKTVCQGLVWLVANGDEEERAEEAKEETEMKAIFCFVLRLTLVR